MSDRPSPLFCRTEEQFLDLIRRELDKGYGFVPLIGSGLSAPSGVPIVRELDPYLQRCVGMALGLVPDGPGTERVRPWNPRTDRWPPFDPARPDPAIDWFGRFAGLVRGGGRSHPAVAVDAAICQEALGALAEWRSALMFLSRLRYDPAERRVELDAPNNEVIDTFFLHVTAGKGPTLGHQCLALLADVLRFNILLTTNFDQLIEQAFRELANPLTVFDIHLNARLPPYRVVQTQRSLVKLHGGRYGLRADYSLDGPPNEDDRHEFVSYLAGRPITPEEWQRFHSGELKWIDSPRNHLLILGLSTKDRRIRELVKFAGSALAPDKSRVFWTCHTDEDTESVARLFDGDHPGPPLADEVMPASAPCVYCKHSFLGLLFLEAYQYFTLSLPASGALFPSEARVPIPPTMPLSVGTSETDEFLGTVSRELAAMRQLPDDRVLTLASRHDVYGVTSVAAEVFSREYEQGTQCVWLDLDDQFGVDDLFEQLLEAVQHKAGLGHHLPVVLRGPSPHLADDNGSAAEADRRDAELRREELARCTRRSGRRWLIFLNAREGAGTNHFPPDRFHTSPGNGWLDEYVPAEGEDPGRCGKRFIALLRLLGATPNVTVVSLCYSGEATVVDHIRAEAAGRVITLNASISEKLDRSNIVPRALEWAERDAGRFRFLYALTRLQRTRFPSIFWCWAFHSHPLDALRRDQDRCRTSSEFLDELLDDCVIRRKPGGFVWMPLGLRARLRYELQERLAGREDELQTLPAETHHGLAEWHHKLYLASHDPLAVFETIYHRCLSAEQRLHRPDSESELGRAVDSLNEATRLLRASTNHILAHGFSKSICRKLEFIRQWLCANVLNDKRFRGLPAKSRRRLVQARDTLAYETIAMNREVAMVVAESLTAFRRHRECLRHRTARARPRPPTQAVASEWLKRNRSDWLDWQRLLGVIHLNHRAYQTAGRCFREAYQESKFPTIRSDDGIDNYLGRVRRWADGASPRDLPRLIKILRRHVQLCYLRAEAAGSAHRHRTEAERGEAEDRPWRAEFDRARFLYRAAEVLLQELPPECLGAYFSERSRLLLHFALVLAGRGDFAQAHRRLNESASYLTESGQPPSPLGEALADLGRAAVYLQEAADDGQLRELRRRILGDLANATARPNWAAFTLPPPGDLRKCLARLDDARRALTRAEQRLALAQKNVYWMTWFFQLKSKLIELTLFCRAGDVDGPVPFVGPEDAPEGTATELDELLDDTGRLVRFDAFRLGNVAEAYANSTLALQIHANRGDRPDAALLTRRHADMADRCEAAGQRLDRLGGSRRDAGRHEDGHFEDAIESPLDTDVAEFVERVGRHVRRVARLSRGWFTDG